MLQAVDIAETRLLKSRIFELVEALELIRKQRTGSGWKELDPAIKMKEIATRALEGKNK